MSILFGSSKGAYTGTGINKDWAEIIEDSDGCILFLDYALKIRK